MNNIIERISKIADNQGIKITNLEKEIGASKGVLSRALKNNTDIQSKWISNIVENYPNYNPEWLLTGKGSMLKHDYEKDVKKDPIHTRLFGDGKPPFYNNLVEEKESFYNLNDHLNNLKEINQLLKDKIAFLEQQLANCTCNKGVKRY